MRGFKWFFHPFSYMSWWLIVVHILLAICMAVGLAFFLLKNNEVLFYKVFAFVCFYLFYFIGLRLYYWKRNSQ